jgi:SAM-dependent methyltransferase
MKNVDTRVVAGFSDEWSRFDHAGADADELEGVFARYFANFPWASLPADCVGFDLGCGSGRWARLVAPRVGRLHCIDPAAGALEVARRNLRDLTNCEFHQATVDAIPLPPASADFGYSLGVLHHVPDTQAGVDACVAKLKRGAPFALYLYYAFDNRPAWFRGIWRASELLRALISRTPYPVRYATSQLFAGLLYWPLARMARLLEKAGIAVEKWPLSFYRDRSFYMMRTDALDRLGTTLEKRFTRKAIEEMMMKAGLEKIVFNEHPPFWTAVGIKA